MQKPEVRLLGDDSGVDCAFEEQDEKEEEDDDDVLRFSMLCHGHAMSRRVFHVWKRATSREQHLFRIISVNIISVNATHKCHEGFVS